MIAWSRAEVGDHRSQLEDYLAWHYLRAGGRRDAWLERQPRVDRLAHGIPHQSHRLRVIGNAVIPAIAEHVGSLIVEDAATLAVAESLGAAR